MARQKNFITVDSKEKTLDETTEVCMTQTVELENLQQEIDKARIELESTKLDIEERKKQALAINPRRDHDESDLRAQDRSTKSTSAKAAAKEQIEKQKVLDNVRVTGKFLNRRAPGQKVKLTYMLYEDDPVKWYELEDGKVYTLPRGFVNQINEYYYTPHFVHTQGQMDSDRPCSAIHEVDTSNKKYSFVPINF
jgi:hypothetical protein